MSPRRRRLCLLLLFASGPATCADAPPPPAASVAPAATPEQPAPTPLPLPRSSIAAVIGHRGELELSDEQLIALEERDQEREKEDAALRDAIEKKKKQAQDAKAAAPSSGGPGGGGRGRGGGMGGKFKGPIGPGRSSPGHEESLEDRLDANDTKAYLDVEDLLNEGQREQAREIASDYRAKLYERREASRAK